MKKNKHFFPNPNADPLSPLHCTWSQFHIWGIKGKSHPQAKLITSPDQTLWEILLRNNTKGIQTTKTTRGPKMMLYHSPRRMHLDHPSVWSKLYLIQWIWLTNTNCTRILDLSDGYPLPKRGTWECVGNWTPRGLSNTSQDEEENYV